MDRSTTIRESVLGKQNCGIADSNNWKENRNEEGAVMGIAKAPAKILLLEARRRPLEGRVLTLGRQDIWVSHKMLREMSAEVGAPLRDAASISLSDKPAFAAQGLLSDRSFFQLLGFSNVESMDYSDYEGADHIVDLNNARMPDNFIGM